MSDIDPIIIFEQLPVYGIHYCKTSLWRMEKTDRFPKRVHLSAYKIGWRKSEIKAWLDARDAERATRRSGSHSPAGAHQAA
jgi:predicted DNA-binding transcriptional regulator AlpA